MTWVEWLGVASAPALAGHEAGEAGGEGVVADLRDLAVAGRPAAASGGLGLGGLEVRGQAERRVASVALGLVAADP